MLDDRANYWLPVDHYIGGIEHAVLHLLYARFYHKLLRDADLVDSDEPFTRLLTQGMVNKGGSKMSKSKGNTVDPQELIDRYGADTVRVYMMFTAPPDQSLEWSDEGVEGAHRFLKRVWSLGYANRGVLRSLNASGESAPERWTGDVQEVRREIHEALHQASVDFERQQFNTVVSACMKIVNALYRLGEGQVDSHLMREGMGILLLLLSPMAPHIAHHLWRELRYGDRILDAGWPSADRSALQRDTLEYVVQVNGKLRSRVRLEAGAERAAVEQAALGDQNVQRFVAGKTVVKVIVVPGKLINVVAK